MKKILSFLLVAIVTSLAMYAASDNKGKISFVNTEHNFGTIQEAKGPVSQTFEFTNTGTGNLLIIDATAQCGCTRPEFPKNPIAPGKKGKIKVTYNPAGRPGSFTKTVTVRTNGNPSKVRLKIKGNVIPK